MESNAIERLHSTLLTYWNNRDGSGMASLFTKEGNAVGFDGTQMNGHEEIERELTQVFTNHKTARYVWKVQEIRYLNSEVALLRAIAGMVPPETKEINPATNSIQTLVAVRQSETWKIALFQNTPAQFHGRPQAVDAMTKELRQLVTETVS
jgi:uncharacterized protein (TIGR02246 family)